MITRSKGFELLQLRHWNQHVRNILHATTFDLKFIKCHIFKRSPAIGDEPNVFIVEDFLSGI